MALLALAPQLYTPNVLPVINDVFLYYGWAEEILAGRNAYSDVPIEYPPGALPFIIAPGVAKNVTGLPYRLGFVGVMIVLDAAALYGLMRLSQRQRAGFCGAWLWVVGLPLLGPVCWLRLDLIPALTTVWAIERFAAGRATTAGAWLGFGAIAKVYPAFLLPHVAVSDRRWSPVVAAAVVAGAGLLPWARALAAFVEHVPGYHARRGIQLETTWSNVLLLTGGFGGQFEIVSRYGAVEIVGPGIELLKWSGILLSIGVVVASSWGAYRYLPIRDARGVVAVWFATLSWLLLTGTVLSPQFLVWLLALGAAATSLATAGVGTRVTLLLAVVLTHTLYPFFYSRLHWQFPEAIILLSLRNATLVILAAMATRDACLLRGVMRARVTRPHAPTLRS